MAAEGAGQLPAADRAAAREALDPDAERTRSWWLATWWRRLGLRARLAVIATAALGVAVAGGAWLGFSALAGSLVSALDGTARQGADQVAALIDANRLPNPVPVAGGTVTVQVLETDGRIRAASPGADLLVPLLSGQRLAAAVRTGNAVTLEGGPYDLPGPMRVVAVRAAGGQIVIAGVSFAQVRASIATLFHSALIGTPILIIFLAGVNWLVIGGALRPIAGLRRGAQEISETVGSRRLPVPETRDEVHSLAVTLNDMLARLQASEARQRELVSDTAHELRSPIASIRAQLEVSLDHPDGVDWQQTATDVLADALRLSRLAEDLLVLARLDERGGGAAPPGRHADLEPVVQEAVGRYASARVPVTMSDGTGSGLAVQGDPVGLARLVSNLVENGVRYASSGVTVCLRRDGGDAVLTVTDDGPGIPQADRERVFNRFVRLDGGRSRDDDDPGGAGLGLAIVRGIAHAFDGRVWLEDAGPGLRAVIRLPLADRG